MLVYNKQFTNTVKWDPTKKKNQSKYHNVAKWVAIYMQFKSVLSVMMDYSIRNI